jgi:hypothetical protein
MHLLGADELRYRDRSVDSDRLAQRLYSLKLMHGRRGKVRLTAMGAGKHWNTLDDQ